MKKTIIFLTIALLASVASYAQVVDQHGFPCSTDKHLFSPADLLVPTEHTVSFLLVFLLSLLFLFLFLIQTLSVTVSLA